MKLKEKPFIEALWNNIQDNPNEGLLWLLPNGEIHDFNKTFLSILNISPEKLLNKTVWEITPEKWHSDERRIFQKLALNEEKSAFYEKEFFHSNGSIINVGVFISAVYDSFNSFSGLWSFIKIIKRKKQAEVIAVCSRKLCINNVSELALSIDKNEEETLKAVIELIPSGFEFPKNICSRIFWNFKCFESDNFKLTPIQFSSDINVFGDKAGQIEIGLIDNKLHEIDFSFDYRDKAFVEALSDKIGKLLKFKSKIAEAALTVENERVRNKELIEANTELKKIQKSMFNLMEDLKRGIEERKTAEAKLDKVNYELKDKNKELEQLIYVASHDMRTPLVTIVGFSNELTLAVTKIISFLEEKGIDKESLGGELRELIDEDIPASLKFMSSGINRIQLMLDALLTYSRAGHQEMKITTVDINSIISDVIDSVRFEIDKTGVNINIDKLPACMADKIGITQVFSNLIENAIKFQKDGQGGHIKVSGKKKGKKVIYSVEDNGKGIPKNKIDDIFLLFYKVDSTSKIGEGLGLAVVKKIIGKLNGKIWVKSEIDQGCKFFIELPSV